MENFAVFASGRGSNFAAIAKAVKKGRIKARLSLLVCDTPNAPVLRRAKTFGVDAVLVERKDFASRDSFEEKIIEHLLERKISLIVMAGFMRMVGLRLIRAYKNRILNIHPALLPAFIGVHAIADAFDYGVKVTGVTVHFVDEEMDHGAIVLQEAVEIADNDTPATLEEKIHEVEHVLYPRAIQMVLSKQCAVRGRKVFRV